MVCTHIYNLATIVGYNRAISCWRALPLNTHNQRRLKTQAVDGVKKNRAKGTKAYQALKRAHADMNS
jgi:hypothetical protein